MSKLLATGKTDLLDGFVSSRTNRKFKAFLVRQADGKVGFEFEPRAPKAGAKTAAKTAKTAGKTASKTAKKTAAKTTKPAAKNAVKKTASKKTAAKKTAVKATAETHEDDGPAF